MKKADNLKESFHPDFISFNAADLNKEWIKSEI